MFRSGDDTARYSKTPMCSMHHCPQRLSWRQLLLLVRLVRNHQLRRTMPDSTISLLHSCWSKSRFWLIALKAAPLGGNMESESGDVRGITLHLKVAIREKSACMLY